MKDRILKLLGCGLSPTLVSTVVGCDPSYVSQLLSEEEFSAKVASLRIKEIEELQQRDTIYNQLEDDLLDKLQTLLPMMLKPRDVLTALQIINNAKRRSSELVSQSTPTAVTNVVFLQLPTKTINSFELNNKGEVVAIDEKPLVAMPTALLMKEIENAKPPPATSLTTVPEEKRLPSEIEERVISASKI